MITWIKESNRWKHLLVGFGIHIFYLLAMLLSMCSSLGLIIIPAITTFLFMAAVEVKDKLGGGKFDWLDILAGIIPSIVISVITGLIVYL